MLTKIKNTTRKLIYWFNYKKGNKYILEDGFIMDDTKKYALLKREKNGLCRIIALKNFSDVKMGDIGGYVQNEYNLSHWGNCWIYDNAIVRDKAIVCENATARNNAILSDKSRLYWNSIAKDNAIIKNKSRIYSNAIIKDNAVIQGNTAIRDFVIVEKFARVLGNSTVRGNTVVTNNARIHNVKVQAGVVR